MAEISDLVGIYGAIDRAVANDSERRARVAQLLPVYRDADLRWFDDFDEWTKERTESEESPFPSVEEALGDLAEIPAEGRMRARRLLAIAVALRAIPELDSDNRDLVVGALRGETLTEGVDHADQLLGLLEADDPLSGEQAFPDDPDVWWERLLEATQGLIRDPDGVGHRPCTAGLVKVPLPGGSTRAATLMTVWETSLVAFDDAIKFLKPVNWPGCSHFWCEMKELEVLPNHVHRYHEVVSTDCANRAHAWTIQAELDFRFTQLADLAITEYELSPGHPKAGDDVLVDEGSLVVHRIAVNRLRITTTKRIEFARYFSAEALAMLMCVLGYASVVEDLVLHCARLGHEGTEFPGKASAKKKGAPPDFGPVIEIVTEEVATAVKDCIDDCVEVVQASSSKMAEGCYTADDLVRDVTGIWVRSVRDGATAIDLGARSARMARARAREP